MATLGATNITTAIAPGGLVPHADGAGLYVEVFRVAGTGTAGDTVALTPLLIGDIRYVRGNLPASDSLSTAASNTSVTLTQGASFATDSTTTYLVELVGIRPLT
jgi:hypothetical protein